MAMFTAIGSALGASTVAGTGLFGASAAATAGAAIVGAGAAGVGASMLMSGSGKKKESSFQAQMPQSPKAPEQKDAAAAAKARLDEKRRSMARSKSIKTNPLGIKDEAEVARKRLLGA